MSGALDLDDDEDLSPEAKVASLVSSVLDYWRETQGAKTAMTFADWNDLGEVTVQIDGRTYRAIFEDVTDED
jgi:hypothetical protein